MRIYKDEKAKHNRKRNRAQWIYFKYFAGGYWADTKNIRKFFEEIARSKGKDPLLPETWYAISRDDILAVKVRNGKNKTNVFFFFSFFFK